MTGPAEPFRSSNPKSVDPLRFWDDAGRRRPALVQSLPPRWRAVSSAVLGGGTGECRWWLNAQVSKDYDRPDPVAHAHELAAGFALTGPGVAMLTAADVSRFATARDDGVTVTATVGLGLPVFAAATVESASREHYAPGTINVLVEVPVALTDAALVNAVITATEAKTQALIEAGVPGTGTSSDALCIACPEPGAVPAEAGEPYGGPRSHWGSRIARAVHAAVAAGTADWMTVHPTRW